MQKGWVWTGEHWVLDVNIIGEQTERGLYKLKMYVEGADYSDFTTGDHIQSIGIDKGGRMWAATDGRFVSNRKYRLLWVA